MTTRPGEVRTTISLPTDLHRAWKTYCVQHGISMQAHIETVLRHTLHAKAPTSRGAA